MHNKQGDGISLQDQTGLAAASMEATAAPGWGQAGLSCCAAAMVYAASVCL